jgi:hypothetical protein
VASIARHIELFNVAFRLAWAQLESENVLTAESRPMAAEILAEVLRTGVRAGQDDVSQIAAAATAVVKSRLQRP